MFSGAKIEKTEEDEEWGVLGLGQVAVLLITGIQSGQHL